MIKYLKNLIIKAIHIFFALKLRIKLLLLMAVVGIFMFVSIVATGQPAFCNSCHIMNIYYDNWKTSSHSDVSCLDCHLKPGLAGYAKGKINGLSQAIDCLVGRVGTKPNAKVEDESCLRSECHNTEQLVSREIDFLDLKFTHAKHISKVVDGINMQCSTCHGHFEGKEHFEVNTEVCFTCHFLKSDENESRLVQTTCISCHEVPDKNIKRGLVSINHKEFVSYKASCEESCHKKQIEQVSTVPDTACLSCHSFRKGMEEQGHESQETHGTQDLSYSQQLHDVHTGDEKVECFDCHGNITHETSEVGPLSAMIDCESCHSDTHNVQFSIYTAQPNQEQHKGSDRVLSPMFLTHVECTGCHVERTQTKAGVLDSFGKVAKAVPAACDKCHGDGTGKQYISFWQKQTKKLHGQATELANQLEERSKLEADGSSAKRLKEAREILNAVSSDGSWGVHNFKYTEEMLRKAITIMDEKE